jgi:hypothetical protein
MSFTVKTETKDPEVKLYNMLFERLREKLNESYITIEPDPYDPDGYLEIKNEAFNTGVAFVIKELEPLVFEIIFEKTHGKQVDFKTLPDEERTTIDLLIRSCFAQYEVKAV